MKNFNHVHTIFKQLPILLIMLLTASNMQADISAIQISLKNDTLLFENNIISIQYLWNNGNIALLDIKNKQDNQLIAFANNKEGFQLNEETPKISNSNLDISENSIGNYKEAIITFDIDNISVKQVLRMYSNSHALRHTYFLKGENDNKSWNFNINRSLEMIETSERNNDKLSRIGHVGLNSRHWKFKAVKFREATDHHDNPVEEKSFVSYRSKNEIQANLLFATNLLTQQTIFILKEAPIGTSQQYYPGFDFLVDYDEISIHGLGLSSKDIKKDWTLGYGYAVGVSKAGIRNEKMALLEYQKKSNPYDFERDFMIMSNTWGDRSKDSRMNETFVLQELTAATKMGVTHFQLDDGWQQGLSRNSASKAGMKWDDWSKEDWMPHKERFPNGLDNIVKSAHKNGIRIGLWFNPSKANSYAKWERDADILLSYYRQYGITNFKIDGLDLNDKQAELNLRSLFSKVKHETNNKAVFNLDVTAGHRIGYHYFDEYGNIFLENRYTDWGNYYPYRSLRNLWLLSSWVPTQRFQIEFLNVNRNQDKYPLNDFAAPHKVGLSYAFAVSMMAQPLAWMEVSQLEDIPSNFYDLVKQYKQVAKEIHSGIILPMGQEPSGSSWTGFLSIGKENQHFLLIFRENTQNKQFKFKLPFTLDKVESILGDPIKVKEKNQNMLEVELDNPWSFNLLKITSDDN